MEWIEHDHALVAELRALLEEQRSEIESLKTQVRELQERERLTRIDAGSAGHAEATLPSVRTVSRAALLRAVAAGAVGLGAATVWGSESAAADQGSSLVLGTPGDATNFTPSRTLLVAQPTASVSTFVGSYLFRADAFNGNVNGTANIDGIEGYGNNAAAGVLGVGGPADGAGVVGVIGGVALPGPALGCGMYGAGGVQTGVIGDGQIGVKGDGSSGGVSAIGVLGTTSSGTGVSGLSTSNVGIYGKGGYLGAWFEGAVPLRLTPGTTSGPPSASTGFHNAGEIYVDSNAEFWTCTVSGSPGTWQPLGSTAPSIHFINTVRILNTRPSKQIGPFTGPIANNQTLTLPIAGQTFTRSDGSQVTVPANASGIIGNLTAADATAPCFLSAVPSGASHVGVSSVNFTAEAPGAGIANALVVGLAGSPGAIDIATGNCSAYNCNIILDLSGYIV